MKIDRIIHEVRIGKEIWYYQKFPPIEKGSKELHIAFGTKIKSFCFSKNYTKNIKEVDGIILSYLETTQITDQHIVMLIESYNRGFRHGKSEGLQYVD